MAEELDPQTQAVVDGLASKVQGLYNSLSEDEKPLMQALLTQAGGGDEVTGHVWGDGCIITVPITRKLPGGSVVPQDQVGTIRITF